MEGRRRKESPRTRVPSRSKTARGGSSVTEAVACCISWVMSIVTRFANSASILDVGQSDTSLKRRRRAVPYPTPVKVQRAGKGQAPPRTLPQRSKFVQVFRRAPPEHLNKFRPPPALPLSSSRRHLWLALVVACLLPPGSSLEPIASSVSPFGQPPNWLHRRSPTGLWPGPSVLALTFLADAMGTSRRWPDRPFARWLQWLSPSFVSAPFPTPVSPLRAYPLLGKVCRLAAEQPTYLERRSLRSYLVQRQHQLPHHPDHRTLRFRAHRVASSPDTTRERPPACTAAKPPGTASAAFADCRGC